MKTHTPETLALIDAQVKALVGPRYDSVKAEFVDFHNDLRTASVVELMQLGIPAEEARDVLYYLQQVNAGMDPTCKQKVDLTDIIHNERKVAE